MPSGTRGAGTALPCLACRAVGLGQATAVRQTQLSDCVVMNKTVVRKQDVSPVGEAAGSSRERWLHGVPALRTAAR